MAANTIADRVALLSYGVINMSMMALMKTVHLFGRERSVIDREFRKKHYTCLEYLGSKVLAEIPVDAVFATVFTTVLKQVTGLRIGWGQLTTIFSLMTAAGASLGFAIGSLSHDGDTALAMGMPVMVLFMVVGTINPTGVDSSKQEAAVVQVLKQLSPIKWAIEGLVAAEFSGVNLEKQKHAWRKGGGAFSMAQNGDQILSALGLQDTTYSNVTKRMVQLSLLNLAVSWIGLSCSHQTSSKKKPRRAKKEKQS